MSYSDEWLKAVHVARQQPKVEPEPDGRFAEDWRKARGRVKLQPKPVEPVPVVSTTWKPWAEMTADERRKALNDRDRTK